MTAQEYRQVIEKAFHALAGYRSPSLTKQQQQQELGRCYELLAKVVFSPKGNK